LIKYLGSKRKLLDNIFDVVSSFPNVKSVGDLFSGTSRVGHHLKSKGYRVESNDINAYAETLAICYVQADREKWLSDATDLIRELNETPPDAGYFTETFCVQARYFQPKNGARIDAIRSKIKELKLPKELEAITLVSLMEAADRVDSTAGVQMAYLKSWASRSNNDLQMRVPDLVKASPHGKSLAFRADAKDAVAKMNVDLMYLDPPYNQHSYLGNYHIWESLVLWDKPEVYGIANKRIDVRDRKSVYNSKREFSDAFESLLTSITSPISVISFNNEGYLKQDDMERFLASMHGGQAKYQTFTHDYKRYVGAQIGIHNNLGEKVGKVSHLNNLEFIYVVSSPEVPQDLLERVSDSRRFNNTLF
jgi:adenine-specific DNA-methyltransferase